MEQFLTFKLRKYAKTELFKIELFICMKIGLAFNNLQWLIFHKTKPNQIKNKF